MSKDGEAERALALQHFDQHSDYWHEVYQRPDTFAGYTLRKQHDFVLERLAQLEAGSRVLDVGCGAGVTALALAARGYKVIGVDIAPRMIERAQAEARRQSLDGDFRVAPAEQLPYPDQSFDALIALGLLGNLRHDAPALREMRRVLKPGGWLLLTMPNALALDLLLALPRSLPIYFLGTRFRPVLRIIGNLARRLIGRPSKDPTIGYGHLAVPALYVQRLRRHGFRDVRYTPLTFGPIIPFGIRWGSDTRLIRASEQLSQWATKTGHLRWAGTSMIYDGRRDDGIQDYSPTH